MIPKKYSSIILVLSVLFFFLINCGEDVSEKRGLTDYSFGKYFSYFQNGTEVATNLAYNLMKEVPSEFQFEIAKIDTDYGLKFTRNADYKIKFSDNSSYKVTKLVDFNIVPYYLATTSDPSGKYEPIITQTNSTFITPTATTFLLYDLASSSGTYSIPRSLLLELNGVIHFVNSNNQEIRISLSHFMMYDIKASWTGSSSIYDNLTSSNSFSIGKPDKLFASTRAEITDDSSYKISLIELYRWEPTTMINITGTRDYVELKYPKTVVNTSTGLITPVATIPLLGEFWSNLAKPNDVDQYTSNLSVSYNEIIASTYIWTRIERIYTPDGKSTSTIDKDTGNELSLSNPQKYTPFVIKKNITL